MALVLGLLLAQAGGVPLAGPFLVLCSADVFLVGLALLSGLLAALLPCHAGLRALLAFGLLIVLALNTRLPAIALDMAAGPAEQVQVQALYRGQRGDPLRVETNAAALTARRGADWAVRPACKDAHCLTTDGFRSYQRWNGQDYWREDVAQVVQRAGFRPAAAAEAAWTLSVSQLERGEHTTVALSLRDPQGAVVARQQSRYRKGWAFETPDAASQDTAGSASAIEFLLHANFINRWAGRHLMPAATPEPLSAFLQRSTQLAKVAASGAE